MERARDTAAPVAGVILAAGLSQRMGQSKLLLPWQGRPIVRHVVDAALRSRLAHLLVVTGAQTGEVAGALNGLALDLIHNPDYASGLASSLRAGILAVPNHVAGVLVMLGDQPRLTGDVIDTLLDAYWSTGAPIVAPFARGRRGNPVLFARALFADLLQAGGDAGARGVIEAHHDQILAVEVDPEVFEDIDTPEAYAALLENDARMS